jgi:hypothetical protein
MLLKKNNKLTDLADWGGRYKRVGQGVEYGNIGKYFHTEKIGFPQAGGQEN